MSDRVQKLPSPQGVAAGETATVKIPLGPTYTAFLLELHSGAGTTPVSAANMKLGISSIRILVDGDVKIEGSAEFFLARAAYYGLQFEAGCLPIPLTMPWARTRDGEDSTGYGTAGGSMASFTMEVDFTASLTTPKMQVYAEQTDPKPFGNHLRIQRYSDNFGFVGEHELSNIALGPHRLLQLDVTSEDVNTIDVLANNVRQQITTPIVRAQLLKNSNRVAQAGFTHVDFIGKNRLDKAMPMNLNDFRVKLGFTVAPDAFNVYVTTIQNDNIVAV